MRKYARPVTSERHDQGRSFLLAGASVTNKRKGLALRSCSMTGGGVLHNTAGRRGRKDGDGTLYRPLICAGPWGGLLTLARLFRPKTFPENIGIGGSTHFLGAALGPLARGKHKQPGSVQTKYSQVPPSRNPAEFLRNVISGNKSERDENAAGECAVICATVSERGRCHREERGRRQKLGRVFYRTEAGAYKSWRRWHGSYGDHSGPARVAKPANLLTRQD